MKTELWSVKVGAKRWHKKMHNFLLRQVWSTNLFNTENCIQLAFRLDDRNYYLTLNHEDIETIDERIQEYKSAIKKEN